MAKGNKLAQIGNIHLPALTNDAHFLYMRDVERIMEEDQAAKATDSVKTAVAALKAAVDEEDKYLMLSRKNPYTDQLTTKDKERDSIFRGYRTAVKGFLRVPVADMAKAAADLWQHLKDYSIDPGMQLERETSRILNLVGDLDTKFAAQVKLLSLKPYVDSLREANEKVEELLAVRTDDRAQQIAGALRKARTVTDEAYLDTVRLINAIVVVGTDKDFTPLINFVNEDIKRYKQDVMKKTKTKDDDKTTSATGCPPASASQDDAR